MQKHTGIFRFRDFRNLPKPNDPNVHIKTTADEYVAVIEFDGYASDEDLKLIWQLTGKKINKYK